MTHRSKSLAGAASRRCAMPLLAALALLWAGRVEALACAATSPRCPLGYSCDTSVSPAQCVATKVCAPFGLGGAYNAGPPTWWHASASTGYDRWNSWIDDPRWGSSTGDPEKGSASITHGDGTQEVVQFRVLHNDTLPSTDVGGTGHALFMQWWVKFTPAGVGDSRFLWVGMGPPAGNKLLVRVALTSTSGTTSTGNSASDFDAEVYTVDSAGNYGSPINDATWKASNPWYNNIRAWVDALEQGVGATGQWGYAIEVPLDVNIGTATTPVTLGTDFQLWYEVLQGTTAAPLIVPATWPRPYFDSGTGTQVSFEATTVSFVEKVPAPAGWASVHLHAKTGADAACGTGGVEIRDTDIHVTYPGQTNPGHIANNAVNTFSATPSNQTPDPIDTTKLHARFRIANWGTQPMSSDADPTTGVWNTVRGLGDVTQTSPAQIAAGASWNLTGTWQPDPSVPDEAGFFDGSKSTHQCIQVELSGPDLVLLHSSNFVNMSIGPASRFQEPAGVTVEGLPSIGGAKRDVYLYVEARNMPDFGSAPAAEVQKGEGAPAGGAVPGNAPGTVPGTAPGRTEPPASYTNVRAPPPAPTFIVHAYYDTGEKLTLKGVSRPVIRPLTAFGYVMKHEGPLEGWGYTLDCNPGLECQALGNDWYRVTLPQNGKGTIVDTIEAIEPKRFSIGLHGGVAIPHGSFASTHSTGFGVRIDGEYFLQPQHALALDLGFDRFGGKSGGSDTSAYRASAAYRYYLLGAQLRPFVTAGLGVVGLDPGNSAAEGFVGAGVQWLFTHTVGGELTYALHGSSKSSPQTAWSDIQVGVRLRF